MSQELKPCPFCGAQPEDPDVSDYFVECPRCGAQGPITNKDGQQHAKEEWNRRAIEAEVLQAQEPKGDPIVELLAAQKPLEPEFAAVMQQCLDEILSEAPDAAPQPPVPCQCAGLEPVAWLHNERKQADVITSAVKKLLTEEKARYGFDSLMQRVKVDKSENYTIPLVRQSDAAAIIAGREAEIERLRAEVERLTTENKHLRLIGESALKVCNELDEVTLALPMDYLDLPDGGNVSLGIQVARMKTHRDELQATIDRQAERIAELESAQSAGLHLQRVANRRLQAQVKEQSVALAESRANDQQAMTYLAQIRKVVGGADFTSMVARVEQQAAALTEQNERMTAGHAAEIKRIHALYTCAACAEGPSIAARLAAKLTAALGKAREALVAWHTMDLDEQQADEALAAIDGVLNQQEISRPVTDGAAWPDGTPRAFDDYDHDKRFADDSLPAALGEKGGV